MILHLRQFKKAALFALCAFGFVVLGAALRPDVPKVVEAERFILRGSDGRPRIEMASIPDALGGDAMITLYDPKGNPRAQMNHRQISFMIPRKTDGVASSRMTLGVGDDGVPIIRLFDESESQRMVLQVHTDGKPVLALTDRENNVRARIMLGPDDSPDVSLWDAKVLRSTMRVTDAKGQSAVSLDLTDAKGNTRATMSVDDKDQPKVELLDELGKPVGKP